MKYTKIVAMLALAASFRAFAINTTTEKLIKIWVVNASADPVGISIEGTKTTKRLGPKVIFASTIIPALSKKLLDVKYNPNNLIPMRNEDTTKPTPGLVKGTRLETYRFRIKRLLPNETFNPEKPKQKYSQPAYYQPIPDNSNILPLTENIDILLVIPPLDQTLAETTVIPIGKKAFATVDNNNTAVERWLGKRKQEKKLIKIQVMNLSYQQAGISVEGTENGTDRGKKVIFGAIVVPEHTLQQLSMSYSPSQLIRGTYKLKVVRLGPLSKEFDPKSSDQRYSQKSFMSIATHSDILLGIPQTKAVFSTPQSDKTGINTGLKMAQQLTEFPEVELLSGQLTKQPEIELEDSQEEDTDLVDLEAKLLEQKLEKQEQREKQLKEQRRLLEEKRKRLKEEEKEKKKRKTRWSFN